MHLIMIHTQIQMMIVMYIPGLQLDDNSKMLQILL